MSGITQGLFDKIRHEITSQGPIPVDRFMALALMDDEFGYYQARDAIGRKGDFITAPEISQIFGELLGLWSAVLWQQMGAPQKFNLVELGPGRGTLMADALRAMCVMPEAIAACDVHLVETGARMREMQASRLEATDVARFWHDQLSMLPPAPMIVLGNEFLDALPVRQFVKGDENWHERVIGLNVEGGLNDESGLRFETGPVIMSPPQAVADRGNAAPGEIAEHRNFTDALPQLREGDAAHPIAALYIDYGHTQSSTGDTLQGVREHEYCDPLSKPGATDITAHVDFADFGAQAKEAGYLVEGPLSQGEFLTGLGIIERAQKLVEGGGAKSRNEIESGVARLISPDAMGSRFKVIGLRSTDCPPLPGFHATK